MGCVGGGEGEGVSKVAWMGGLPWVYSVDGSALCVQEVHGLPLSSSPFHAPCPYLSTHFSPTTPSPCLLHPSQPPKTKRPTLVKALPQPSCLHLYRRGSRLPLVLVLVMSMVVGVKETGMGSSGLTRRKRGGSGRTTRLWRHLCAVVMWRDRSE